MMNSVKREITGDIGLIPECDIPLGSERIDIVERYFFGVRQFTGPVYSLCCASLCFHGLCELYSAGLTHEITDFNLFSTYFHVLLRI